MATGKKFWNEFESGQTISNMHEFDDKTLPIFNEKNFCCECVGCAGANSKPTAPIFKLVGRQIYSNGGTCYEPRVYNIKTVKAGFMGTKSKDWVATHFLKNDTLVRL